MNKIGKNKRKSHICQNSSGGFSHVSLDYGGKAAERNRCKKGRAGEGQEKRKPK